MLVSGTVPGKYMLCTRRRRFRRTLPHFWSSVVMRLIQSNSVPRIRMGSKSWHLATCRSSASRCSKNFLFVALRIDARYTTALEQEPRGPEVSYPADIVCSVGVHSGRGDLRCSLQEPTEAEGNSFYNRAIHVSTALNKTLRMIFYPEDTESSSLSSLSLLRNSPSPSTPAFHTDS